MEAAGTVLEVLSVSFGTLQKAVAGRPREQAKRARSEQQMPVEAAGRVLEVLSVSFETLQKAPARPRASGSCREGFGGAIRQFRNPTKSCGWKAKGARSEQLMQVCSESRWKLQGRFWKSYKKLWLEGQGSQERTANAGESRSKLQGRFWRCYPSVSEPYKKLRLGQEPVEAAERVLEGYPSVSEPYKKLWLEGQGSQERTANAGESRWKLQGRFWRCYPSVSEHYKELWLEGQGSEQQMRVEAAEGFGGQFRNLQKDPARGREPGASSECQWRVLEVLSGTFETPPKLRL